MCVIIVGKTEKEGGDCLKAGIKIRKTMTAVGVVVASIILLIAITLIYFACLPSYRSSDLPNGLRVDISEMKNYAVAKAYSWDGTKQGMTIDIPDEAEGYPVRALGRDPRGAEYSWFYPELPRQMTDYIFGSPFVHGKSEYPYDMHELVFTVNLGKSVEKVYGGFSQYYGKKGDVTTVYWPTIYFCCDEENRTFYARDGKLYYKKDDSLVEGFNLDYASTSGEITDEYDVGIPAEKIDSVDLTMHYQSTGSYPIREEYRCSFSGAEMHYSYLSFNGSPPSNNLSESRERQLELTPEEWEAYQETLRSLLATFHFKTTETESDGISVKGTERDNTTITIRANGVYYYIRDEEHLSLYYSLQSYMNAVFNEHIDRCPVEVSCGE